MTSHATPSGKAEQTPTTHEPPKKEEQPDEDITGEQPRSRSNEGDPQNAPE